MNIGTDKDIRDQADRIFSDRENGIPFGLNPDVPNETTAAALEEGRLIAADSSVKGYTNMHTNDSFGSRGHTQSSIGGF